MFGFATTACSHRRQSEHEMFPIFPWRKEVQLTSRSPCSPGISILICEELVDQVYPRYGIPFPTEVPPSLTTTHKVQPSPFPFRSRWPRRIDAHVAAASCTPKRRDASCSRNPPLPLRSHHAMRFALWRTNSRPHNACHLPFAGEAAAIEEPRDAAAAARSPPLHRANPPDPPTLFWRESDSSPLACQSLPGSSPSAEDTRECAGGLVATLTPRRAARRCGKDLARPPSSVCVCVCVNRQWAVIGCADVAAARLCRGGCCAHAAARLSRETAGDAARRRHALRSSDGPQRGVRGAARRSASASAPALPLSVAAGGGGGAAAVHMLLLARRGSTTGLDARVASI